MASSTKVLNWTVKVGGETVSGSVEDPSGVVRIHPDVPAGPIESVEATLEIPMDDDERAFFNGYQTWTHCPEYKKTDRIRGLNGVPRFIKDKFHIDHFGDYHFVDYPNRPGRFHGFSWCYIRKEDDYRMVGSLDERPGYTIFRYDAESGAMAVERDCAGVEHPGGELAAFDLYFAEGSEDEVFDGWFAKMDCECTVGAPIKGYSSWYNRYEDITQQTVLDDLEGCKTLFEPGDLFQIDDGWEPAVGDWLEPDEGKFPVGMRAMADAAHEAGFKAGLWLAPFVCEKDSQIFRERPDWLLKVDGEPWACGPNWSGFYSLDIDNPEVQDYLKVVFGQVFKVWGFDLVKLDFLYGAAPFGTSAESRAGRMIRAMEMLREWCGDALILGCGVPVMPAFGLVDYCRIGPDVSLNGKGELIHRMLHREIPSTRNSMDNAVYRRQLNGRAYGSDPDVFFLRHDNIKLSLKDKVMLAYCDVLFGSVLLTSDNPSDYTPEGREFYSELLELRDAKVVNVDPVETHKWVVNYEIGNETHRIELVAP